MAFVEYLPPDDVATFMPFFINVTNAVGESAANSPEDVMVVQFLLQEVYRCYSSQGAPKPTTNDMQVDGWYGPQTRTWITSFQRECFAHGIPIRVDGRVDRAYGVHSASTGTTYTIILLNHELYRQNPELWSVDRDTFAPAFLLNILHREGVFAGR